MDKLLGTSEKFQKVLQSFLASDYKVVDDVYMDMLISHLSGKNGKEYGAFLQSPFVLEWLDKCLELLLQDFNRLNPQVTSFMLRLCALMAENEWAVIHIRDRRFGDKIQNIMQIYQEKLTPAVKLGHIRFLTAVSAKSLGVGWIKNIKAWQLVVDYCRQNQTIYVFYESKKLLADILYKVSLFSENAHNDELVIEILTEIMKPIIESVYNDSDSKVKVDEYGLQRKIEPTLCLLSHILQKSLENESKTKIWYYLETYFNFEKNLWKLADMTQNEEFFGKILNALTSSNFARLLYEKCNNGRIASEDFNQFGVSFFNFFKCCVSKKSYYNVIRMAELNHILWKKLGNRAPEEVLIENERIQFENQIITFHLVPVLFVLRSQLLKNEELFDNYLMKLFTISCEFTQRICYAFRDVLFECPEISEDLANKSIHGIISLKNVLNQDRAVLVFEAMIYALKNFVPEVCSAENQQGAMGSDPLNQVPNVLFATLVGLHTLIQKYRITWKESLATTCLMNFMLELLSNPNLSSRLVIQAIKLTQLSIEHFLSPNLALLIENLNGTGMQNLGPMILKRLHDNAWEVRDSTLELVTSITNISQLKFPAFQQKVLLDSGICPIIFSMAKHDSESYVRASALKCLCQMIVINLLWEQSLNTFDIVDHLLTSLFVETEGIVRKEAILLLTQIYSSRKIAPEKMNCIFSTLIHCAVNDLHWEVKINSLCFWKVFICEQFTNQGMIDGTFPTVTFSKEKKKIVTLTEKEILLRIHKILNDLSEQGCLGVILECLNDDCDFEVVKIAVAIVKKLFEFLNKYDYLEKMGPNLQNNNKICQPSTSTNNKDTINSIPVINDNDKKEVDFEDVIDSIVGSLDINLLSVTYQNQMQVQCDSGTCRVNEYLYKEYKVTPTDFLNRINSLDLDQIINKRSDWIMNTESLDSLLDDMLSPIKIQTTESVNDADCY